MRTHTIGVIPGDGIGPELVEAAITVLDAACASQIRLDLREEDAGAGTYRRTGRNIAPEALARIRDEYEATLKGPVGLPEVRKPDGTEGGVLGGTLRNGLDTYANVRPIRCVPGIQTPLRPERSRIDYVIVRENTEGLYLSRGLGVGNERAVADQLLLTRVGVERVVRFAFGLARTRQGAPADGVRRVTCVDKSNVLRSFAFFRRVFDEVAGEYPDVEPDYRYADAAGHDLVTRPEAFDVLVMENFVGDILSDVGAATVGGLGMCPAGNVGDRSAYFEPVHGSAPTIAGRGLANPVSQILSAAMLMRHVGETKVARRIEDAVDDAFRSGAVALGPTGSPVGGTRAVTAAIVAGLLPAGHSPWISRARNPGRTDVRPMAGLGWPAARQMDALARTAARGWRPVPDDGRLPTGAEAARWLAGFICSAWEELARPCPEAAVDLAVRCAAAREAAFDPDRAVLVHGDVHAFNALQVPGSPAGAFRLVDAQGLISEPAHDLGVIIVRGVQGQAGELAAAGPRQALETVARHCRRAARQSGADPEAVWQWAFTELVSTGLFLLRLGRHEEAGAFLATAGKLAAATANG